MVDYLFVKSGRIYDFLEERKNKFKNEIASYDPAQHANDDEYREFVLSKHKLESPTLNESETSMEKPTDTKIDVSEDPDRIILNRNRPFYVQGTKLTIYIPFSGNKDLFHYTPQSYTTLFPKGEVFNNELRLVFQTAGEDQTKIVKDYQSELDLVKKYLVWIKQDVNAFNSWLESNFNELLGNRKQKLMTDSELARALNIPIKRYDEVPKVYTIPVSTKKPSIQKTTGVAMAQDPGLALADYEGILEIIQNMSLVMERNPKTFSKLQEEEIRDHFLLILNTYYEGQATGETFNSSGKTDILMRYQNNNVFVAECKFWKGEKLFLETIDQLLGYITWRDTKTSVLIFNKNQNFSEVLKKIRSSALSHKCFETERKLGNSKLHTETTIGYIFHHPSDSQKKFVLTIMAFDIAKLE